MATIALPSAPIPIEFKILVLNFLTLSRICVPRGVFNPDSGELNLARVASKPKARRVFALKFRILSVKKALNVL